jgi:hypothetical protein
MLKRIGSLLYVSIVLLYAGELNFTASIDRTEIGIGEPLMLTVTVAGENIGSVPSPQLPDLPDFTVAGRSSSQSTSIQFVNGQISKQQTIRFVYTLYPEAVGEHTIGPCTIEFEGETYQTQPIAVNVVKGTTAPQQPASPGVTPAEPGVPIKESLRLVATANRRSVYVGEQITVEFALYNRFTLRNLNIAEYPTFAGFWAEPIFDAQRLDPQRKVIDGIVYQVSVLKKTALYPTTSGTCTITPMKLDAEIVQPPRDFFDVFGTVRRVTIASDPIFITVKPLPLEGQPETFTGGVGEFSVRASLDRTISEGAEPINLQIRITGTGNLKLIEKPTIPSIPGVKILDPEIEIDTDASSGAIRGFKEFTYPLIPQTDGEYLIPEIEMAYFDPANRQYRTLTTSTLIFTATKTTTAPEIAEVSGIDILGTDIHYIKSDVDRLPQHSYSAGMWLIFLYIGSLFIIGISILYRHHQSRLLSDQAYARKLRSSGRVRKRLKEAQHALKRKDMSAFYAALSRGVLGYIGDRYNLETGALTQDELFKELHTRDIKDEKLRSLKTLLDKCDLVRFSPNMKCDDPEQLLKETKKVLGDL